MNERTGNTTAVRVVSVILAIVFLLAGIPKILGVGAIGLQAASMQGFPAWIRIVTGVCEVVGAIALLVPSLSIIAAIALALLMIPAFVTQRLSGQAGLVIPVIVFLALLFVAWRRDPETVHRTYRRTIDAPHPLLRDGVIAGIIGATCIAVLFFVVDLTTGHLLLTPAVLGRALVSIFAPNVSPDHTAGFVIAYTIFHYAAFIVVGIIASMIVYTAYREPSILVGFVVLFAFVEVGFYGLVALLSQATPLGAFAWYDVMIGNVVAALAMGIYLWRMHPRVTASFRHSLDGEEQRTGTGARAPIPRA